MYSKIIKTVYSAISGKEKGVVREFFVDKKEWESSINGKIKWHNSAEEAIEYIRGYEGGGETNENVSIKEFLSGFIFDDLDMSDFGPSKEDNRILLTNQLLESIGNNCDSMDFDDEDEEAIAKLVSEELDSWD